MENTLIHTAENLKIIASHYRGGVYVWEFEPVEKPTLKVVSLASSRLVGSGRLSVYGGWDVYDVGGGSALGGLVSGEARAKLRELPK